MILNNELDLIFRMDCIFKMINLFLEEVSDLFILLLLLGLMIV
jgi:hypothetical protein